MSVALAYGLVSQAIIAAAAVRIAFELRWRRGGANDAAGSTRPRNAARPAGASEQSRGDMPAGVSLAMLAGPLALLVPIGTCSVAEHMRGIWGDPSIITCALLAVFIARPNRLPARPSRAPCIALTLLVTVPLYAPLLGIQLPVPELYALGWQPDALLAAIAVAAALLMLLGRWCATWAVLVAIGMLAYSARVMESSNLLDYLADPGLLLTIGAMAALPRARSLRTAHGASSHE